MPQLIKEINSVLLHEYVINAAYKLTELHRNNCDNMLLLPLQGQSGNTEDSHIGSLYMKLQFESLIIFWYSFYKMIFPIKINLPSFKLFMF